MQNLLQILQAFSRRTGLPVPTAAVASQDLGVKQLVGLLEEVGEELVSRFNWTALRKKATVTSVAAQSQGNIYTLAGTDLERIVPDTLWNVTDKTPFYGPATLSEWQAYLAGIQPGTTSLFTVLGNELLVMPTPAAGETYTFWWQTKKWILDPDGTTTKATFDDDGDTPLLDDMLLTLGLRAYWKREKGLPYAEELRAFEAAAMDKSARDGPRPTVSMAGGPKSIGPSITLPLFNTIP